jgi:hypothetical protein
MGEIEKLKKIDEFHKGRIEKIKRNEITVPYPFPEGAKIALYLIPHDAMNKETYYNLGVFDGKLEILKPLKDPSHDLIYYFDGLMSFTLRRSGECMGYVQLYGNGIIEAIDGYYLDSSGEKIVPTFSIEKSIKQKTAEYLSLQKGLSAELPIFIYLDFLNVRDYRLDTLRGWYMGNIHSFDNEDLNFQRLSIDNYDAPITQILKTWFDRLWNAGGYPRSAHYDEGGDWISR